MTFWWKREIEFSEDIRTTRTVISCKRNETDKANELVEFLIFFPFFLCFFVSWLSPHTALESAASRQDAREHATAR